MLLPRNINVKKLFLIAVTIAVVGLSAISMMHGKMFVIVENTPLTDTNYSRIFSSNYIWNELLGSSSPDQGVFNFRTYIWLTMQLTGLELGQVLLLFKIGLVALSFIGFYKFISFLNEKYFNRKLHKHAMIIGSLLYTLNPSFLIGDHFWVGIQVGYYTLPLIVFLAGRILADNKFVFLFPLAFIFSINNAGHFTFGGYEIILMILLMLIFWFEKKNGRRLARLLASASLIFIVMFGSQASYILGSLAGMSEGATTMTKASIDVPWSSATINNLSSGMGYTQILNDYYLSDNRFIDSFIYILMGVTPTLIILPLLRYRAIASRYNNRRIIYIAVSLIAVYILTVLCFASDSPFNFMRYIVASELPFGRIFRTWRIPTAILAIITGIIVSISLSIVLFADKRRQLIYKRFVVIMTVMSLMLFIFPLFMGRMNGPVIDTPTEYLEISKNITENNTDNGGISLIPAFVSAYGHKAPLKPNWSQEMGMILEFGVYSMPERTLAPQNATKDTYLYTSSEFYRNTSLLLNDRLYAMARIYALSNTTNLVIHSDMPSAVNTPEVINNFKVSPFWEQYSSTDNSNIFKNQITTEQFRVVDETNIATVNGGFRALARFFDQQQRSYQSNTEFIFIDQGVSFTQLSKIQHLISDKGDQQNFLDYLHAYTSEQDGDIIYPASLSSEYDIDKYWSTLTQKSVHQQEWQPYINRMSDYAWDNDYGQGFLATAADGAKISIHNTFNSRIDKLLIRYLASDAGGEISLGVCGETIQISTERDYGGYLWREIDLSCSSPSDFTLTNIKGMNSISTISGYTNDEYISAGNIAMDVLSTTKVINSEADKGKDLVPGDNFHSTDDLELWESIKATGAVSKSIDETTGSMVVERLDDTQEWSWLSSPVISVKSNGTYLFSTSMSQRNSINSHITIEAIDSDTGITRQLIQLPAAITGTTEKHEYSKQVTIPNNVEKIRIILNAGWILDDEAGKAMTTFSQIHLSPLEEISNAFNLSSNSSQLVSMKRINPTKIALRMKYPRDRVNLVSTSENYDRGWKAYISPNDSTMTTRGLVRDSNEIVPLPEDAHIKVNGYANGWLIDPAVLGGALSDKSTLDIIIEYTPQRAFETGIMITSATLLLTFVLSSIFFVRSKRRPTYEDSYYKDIGKADRDIGG